MYFEHFQKQWAENLGISALLTSHQGLQMFFKKLFFTFGCVRTFFTHSDRVDKTEPW